MIPRLGVDLRVVIAPYPHRDAAAGIPSRFILREGTQDDIRRHVDRKKDPALMLKPVSRRPFVPLAGWVKPPPTLKANLLGFCAIEDPANRTAA